MNMGESLTATAFVDPLGEFAAAMQAARDEGYRAGIEAAAKVADKANSEKEQRSYYPSGKVEFVPLAPSEIARRIRALAPPA